MLSQKAPVNFPPVTQRRVKQRIGKYGIPNILHISDVTKSHF